MLKFKAMLPMKIYGAVARKLSKRGGKLMCAIINSVECDEFLSVDDGFLLGFIIVNLHICFVTSQKGNFYFRFAVRFVIQLRVFSPSVFAQHKHL